MSDLKTESRFPRMMKLAQVCEALNLSRPSVYRLLESGEIPYVQMRGTRRVREEDVLIYIERQTVKRESR